jgi:hypothetical protein
LFLQHGFGQIRIKTGTGQKESQFKEPVVGKFTIEGRVSFQGVKSLSGHFACLCRPIEFYEEKKIIIFHKENGNTFTLFIIFIVKSLQKEQKSTNLLL